MKKITLLGLGKMGTGMALSLLRSGYALTVWNRSKAKAEPVIAAGAGWADTPAAAAAMADIVIAMLADDGASETVWLGEAGALAVMKPGATVIECSTLSLAFVQRLSAAAIQHQLRYIDCPVTGIPAVALKGELTLLAGGDKAVIEDCRPVLESLSKTIRYFGPIGKGTAYKLVINLMGAIQIAALAEGIALCQKLELPMDAVVQAIEQSAAASPQVVRYANVMATKQFATTPSFTVALREKDAAYALQLAESHNFDARLGRVATNWFAEAKSQHATKDEAMVITEMIK